ncbi:MAG: hypothetical protein ACK4HE_09415 [Chitinophagaceae bacterium]
MKHFNTEQLIMYVYNNLPTAMVRLLEKELTTNWVLREKLSIIQESKQLLSEQPLKKPRKKSVASILAYAARTNNKTKVSEY